MRLYITLLLFIPISLFGQNASDWQVDIKDEIASIKWLQQANDGTLIIGGNKGLIGLDNKTGDVLWKNKQLKVDDGQSVIHVDPLPFILLETNSPKANIVMMETKTGNVITNSENADFTVMNYNLFTDEGLMLFELKENEKYKLSLYDIVQNETKWEVPIDKAKKGIKGLFKGQTPFLSKPPHLTGETFITNYKKKVMAINVSTGDIVWAKEFEKKIGVLFVAGDEIFLSQGKEVIILDTTNGEQTKNIIKLKDNLTGYQDFGDGFYLFNQKGFNPFNGGTKAVKWSDPDKIKETHDLYNTKHGFVSINLGEETRVGDEGSVTLVDDKGKKLWQKTYEGIPIYVFPTVKGVFFISDQTANVYSYTDGKKLMKKDIKIKDGYAVAFDEENQEVVIYSDKKISIFNVNSGDLRTLVEDLKLKKFDSEKDLLTLEIRPKGYLLYTSNNMSFVSNSGNIDFNQYYSPVKGSWLLGAAMDIANSAAGFNNSQGSSEGFQKVESFTNAVVVSGEKTSSGRQSKSSTVTASEETQDLFAVSVSRYYASSETKDFLFVFTQEDGQKQLFKINKDSGDVTNKFEFKEKEPTYLVDEYDQRLYYLDKTSVNSVPLN